MARYTFFSFSYEDVKNFKVNVVRNSWLLNNSSETFIDGSIWEKEKSKGASVIKNIIETGLNKTSVTTVLIGSDTAERRWVKYEIIKSFERGNGILAIYINRIRGKEQTISAKGQNPLNRLAFQISEDGRKIRFYELVNRKWVLFSDLPEINNKKSNPLPFNGTQVSANNDAEGWDKKIQFYYEGVGKNANDVLKALQSEEFVIILDRKHKATGNYVMFGYEVGLTLESAEYSEETGYWLITMKTTEHNAEINFGSTGDFDVDRIKFEALIAASV